MGRKKRHATRKASKNRIRKEIELANLKPLIEKVEAHGWVSEGISLSLGSAAGGVVCHGWVRCPVSYCTRQVFVRFRQGRFSKRLHREFRDKPHLLSLPVGETASLLASRLAWEAERGGLAPEPFDPLGAMPLLFGGAVDNSYFQRLPRALRGGFLEVVKGVPWNTNFTKLLALKEFTTAWWDVLHLDEAERAQEARRVISEGVTKESRLVLLSLLYQEEERQAQEEDPASRSFLIRDYCEGHQVTKEILVDPLWFGNELGVATGIKGGKLVGDWKVPSSASVWRDGVMVAGGDRLSLAGLRGMTDPVRSEPLSGMGAAFTTGPAIRATVSCEALRPDSMGADSPAVRAVASRLLEDIERDVFGAPPAQEMVVGGFFQGHRAMDITNQHFADALSYAALNSPHASEVLPTLRPTDQGDSDHDD